MSKPSPNSVSERALKICRWVGISRIDCFEYRARSDDRRFLPPNTVAATGDCLYALQASISNLTCSSLHRCLKRHGISRLPEIEGDNPVKKKFKHCPIGYFHIDIAEVNTEEDDFVCSSLLIALRNSLMPNCI